MAASYHDIASLLRTLSFAPKPLVNDKKFCAVSCIRQPGQMEQDSLFSSALVVEFILGQLPSAAFASRDASRANDRKRVIRYAH
jgi:hypothetical protein